MSNDAGSHELLAIVATVHHNRIREPLNDGTSSLAEAFRRISTSGVWEVHGGADLDVVAMLRMDKSAYISRLFCERSLFLFFATYSNSVSSTECNGIQNARNARGGTSLASRFPRKTEKKAHTSKRCP